MPVEKALEGAPNLSMPLPWLATAGQPSEAQLRAAAANGVTTVIDLRDPMEPRPFDEPALMAELGINYVNVPIGSGSLDEASLDKVLATLREQQGQQHGGHDRGAGEDHQVGVLFHVGLAFAKHGAPRRVRWLDAEAEEAEARLGEDRRRDRDSVPLGERRQRPGR